jgi:hypothetical protein
MTNAFTIPKGSSIAQALEKRARISRSTTNAVNNQRREGKEPNRMYGISEAADKNIMNLTDTKKLVVELKRS